MSIRELFHLFCILLLTGFPLAGKSQNLVANSSFEITTAPPSTAGQFNLVMSWGVVTNALTPDLYYKAFNFSGGAPCNNVSIPFNATGYCEERTNRNYYAGLRFDLTNNSRSYIYSNLPVPITAGKTYRVQFFTQLADSSRFACNGIGALLTAGIPAATGNGLINLPATIMAPEPITDRNNWVLVTGLFTATSTLNYITIGLFMDDTDPLLQKVDSGVRNSGCTGIDNGAYYLIDDVQVTEIVPYVNIEGDTIVCPNEATVLTADSNVPFWWSSSDDPNDTISLQPELVIVPTDPMTYYLNSEFGTDSVTVTIVPAPVFDIGPDTVICEGVPFELDAFAPDGILYNWSTGDTGSTILVSDTGMFYVVVDNIGCGVVDSIHLTDFLDNPAVNLGEDSLYCFYYNDTLTLDAGAGTSYLWTPTNQISREITILNPGDYSVTVSRSNGCTRTASLSVSEICEPTAFIPSAFTPDGDGLNDILKPYVSNFTGYSFRVYDRFGQLVYYSEDPDEGWDGRFKGEDAPIGIYVYRVNYKGFDRDGIKTKRKLLGSVSLLR